MPGDRRDHEVAPTIAATDPGSGPDRGDAGDATLPGPVPPPRAANAGDGRFAAGQSIGRYEIEYLIGRGGMGEVYAAYDPNLDRAVAVKVLLAALRGEAHAARLVREAQALARLQHPNVVAVHDAGEDRGHVFLAMQLVEGETLATHLRTQPRRWTEVVALFLAAGRGLAAAHAAGIVHRDFKPSNVLVDRTGHVAVTDFGLARQAGDPVEPARPSDPSLSPWSGRRASRSSDPVTPPASGRRASRPSRELTRQGELVGTPAYMPAEQLAGAEITPATDQFSFCVALWEALFARHPFAGTDADGSPLAYAAALERGVLHLPERHPVPRRIVAALTRGLARDAAGRWPAMEPLLAELDRGARPRHLPLIVACGAVVLVGGTVAAVLALQDHGGAPPCAATARSRIATVWDADRAPAIAARFTATDRPYAAATAAQIGVALDEYSTAWTAASIDACTASRGGDAASRQRAERRLACLDRAHAMLTSTVGLFTVEVGGDVVDAASSIVRALPALDDCNSADVGAAPPAAVARRLPELEARLHAAATRGKLGQPRVEAEQLAALTRDAADLGWEPFAVRLDYQRAINAHDLGGNSHDALLAIAVRARSLGLHRLELDASQAAMLDAVDDAGLETAVTSALAAAAAIGGPRVKLEVGILHGRGLGRRRAYKEAASLCRDGRAVAHDNHWSDLEDQATACLLEALLPLGRYGEFAPLIDEALAAATTRLGAEHPTVASFLEMKATVLENQGKFADAEAVLQRVLAIRRRAYGEHDLQVAGALRLLGGAIAQLDDHARAKELLDQALAIASTINPPPDGELWKIHRDLGMLAMATHSLDDVRVHFELAIESATRLTGPDSIEVGFLLVMYGQYQTAWDVDAGLASLRRAIEIFAAHDDPRVAVVRGALGAMLTRLERWSEAIPLLEDGLSGANLRDVEPLLLGQMSFTLAQSLKATRKLAHARQHAEDALEYFAKAGDAAQREQVRDWIKDEKLPPYRTNAQLRAAGTPIPEHAGR